MKALSNYLSLILTLSMVTLASTAAFISIRDYYNEALRAVHSNGFRDIIVDETSSSDERIVLVSFTSDLVISKMIVMFNGSVVAVVENTLHYSDQYILVDFLNASIKDEGVFCSENSVLVIILKNASFVVILNTDKGDYYIG